MNDTQPKYKQVTGIFAVKNKKDDEQMFFVVGVETETNQYQVIIFDSRYSCYISNREKIKTEYEYLDNHPLNDAISIKLVEQFNNVNKIQINPSSSIDNSLLFKC